MNKLISTLLVFVFLCTFSSAKAYATEIKAELDTPKPASEEPAEETKVVQALHKDAANNSADSKTNAELSPVALSVKPTNTRKDEPALARIPKLRKHAKPSKKETRFQQIKKSLQGPEGLLHLSKLEVFVKRHPDHLQARLWLIRSQLLAQQEDNALNSIGEPDSWQDPDWQVSYWKAQVYIHHGQLGYARRAMDYALSNKSDSADIWVQQAVLEQESNNHDGAIQLLKIALEVEPSNANAQLNLGFSLEHLSEFSAALTAYRRYLSNGNASNSTLRLKILQRVELLARYNAQNNRSQPATNISIR